MNYCNIKNFIKRNGVFNIILAFNKDIEKINEFIYKYCKKSNSLNQSMYAITKIEFCLLHIKTVLKSIKNYIKLNKDKIRIIKEINYRISIKDKYIIYNTNKKRHISNHGFNIEACNYFDKINKEYGLDICHMLNGGEVIINIDNKTYYLDGYSEKYNTVIEFDEQFHFRKENQFNDKIRENNIKKELNCNFIRINYKYFPKIIDYHFFKMIIQNKNCYEYPLYL